MFTSLRSKQRPLRKGAAVVEFAITAPIVFMFFVAIIIFAQASLLRDTAQHAAYEGARAVIMPGANADMARTAVQGILSTVGVTAGPDDIDVDPENLTTSTREVTVTVTIPMDANLWMRTPWLPEAWIVEESIRLEREVE